MPAPRARDRISQQPARAGGDSPRPLTDRHVEILRNVAQGRTNREIGEALGISERTVRNHMREIMKRLSSSDRTHSVVLAIGHGWIAIPIQPEEGGIEGQIPPRGPHTKARA